MEIVRLEGVERVDMQDFGEDGALIRNVYLDEKWIGSLIYEFNEDLSYNGSLPCKAQPSRRGEKIIY